MDRRFYRIAVNHPTISPIVVFVGEASDGALPFCIFGTKCCK